MVCEKQGIPFQFTGQVTLGVLALFIQPGEIAKISYFNFPCEQISFTC